jgi:hypothetical protein
MVSLLLYFLSGLPHFFISALLDSPTFTSVLPQRKLVATALLERNTNKTHIHNLFIFYPLLKI